MSTFREHITIRAPRTAVWTALADIGSIHTWNPGVHDSRRTSEQAEGVGATRSCDLGGRNYLHEAVTTWEPPERLTMSITDTNLPFARADIRFALEDRGDETLVTVAPDYALKFGPLGRLLDRFFVRSTYAKGMRGLLRGLKDHVESRAPSASTSEPKTGATDRRE